MNNNIQQKWVWTVFWNTCFLFHAFWTFFLTLNQLELAKPYVFRNFLEFILEFLEFFFENLLEFSEKIEFWGIIFGKF